jgi:hypothetical protein
MTGFPIQAAKVFEGAWSYTPHIVAASSASFAQCCACMCPRVFEVRRAVPTMPARESRWGAILFRVRFRILDDLRHMRDANVGRKQVL